jgi:hypothetical protein
MRAAEVKAQSQTEGAMSAKRNVRAMVLATIAILLVGVAAYGQNLVVMGTTTGQGSTYLATLAGSNVGVGTATPGAKLHVVAAGGFGAEPIRAQSAGTFFSGVDASGTQRLAINNDGGPTLGFYGYDGNWFPWMTVNNAGGRQVSFNAANVGIGTTSPVEKLEIGSGGFVGTRIDPGNDTTQGLAGFNMRSRETGGALRRWSVYTAAVGGGFGVVPNSFSIWDYPGTPGSGTCCFDRFTIAPAPDGSTTVTSVRIDPLGNLGVGTTAPAAKLDIKGDYFAQRYFPRYAAWGATGDGGAAITNDNGSFKALMIVGNNSAGGVRQVGIWDNLTVNGTATVTSTLTVNGRVSASGGFALSCTTVSGVGNATCPAGYAATGGGAGDGTASYPCSSTSWCCPGSQFCNVQCCQ